MSALSNFVIVPYVKLFSISSGFNSAQVLNPVEGNFSESSLGTLPILVYEVGFQAPLLFQFGLNLAPVAGNGQPVDLRAICAHVCERPPAGNANSLYRWDFPVPGVPLDEQFFEDEPGVVPLDVSQPLYMEQLPAEQLFQFAGNEAVLKPEDFANRSSMQGSANFFMLAEKGHETIVQAMFHVIEAVPPPRNAIKTFGMSGGVEYGGQQSPLYDKILRIKLQLT